MPNRYYANALPTTLSATVNNSVTTVQIASITGLPSQYPFSLLAEWGTPNFEVITVTQASTGAGPYTFANCVRGDDGTTAIGHSSGVPVAHGFSARDFATPISWITMPLSNSWTNLSGVTPCKYGYDYNGDLVIIGGINGSSATNRVFANLPSGYRPVTTQQFWLSTSGTYGQVNSGGQLLVQPGTYTSSYFFSAVIRITA